MKRIAKWVVIIWSILCLVFICGGLINVTPDIGELEGDFETAGGAIGMGCGLGILLIIWLAIAGPALIIYLVSGKKEITQVEIVETPQQVKLCNECGKYYEGEPKFCPNCGKQI